MTKLATRLFASNSLAGRNLEQIKKGAMIAPFCLLLLVLAIPLPAAWPKLALASSNRSGLQLFR